MQGVCKAALACVLVACVASSAMAQDMDSTFRNRDEGPHDSYSSYHPPPVAPEPAYYYPAEEVMEEMEEKKCLVQKLMPTLVLVDIFLGIIAGVLVGLIPPLKFPAQWNGLVNTLFPVPPNSRAIDEEVSGMVARALESDECLPRLMCETGKFAEGMPGMLIIMDLMTPTHHEDKMKIFTDSAMSNASCETFSCGLADDLESAYTLGGIASQLFDQASANAI